MADLMDLVWNYLQTSLDKVRADVTVAVTRSERSEVTGAVEVKLLANAPLLINGAGIGDVLFISNARKVGEGPGAGTGTVCYYNVGTDSWFRVADDTAAVI